ncbi:MAG TPA: hypothetical protein VNJ08_06550 [Bacteriovoracaceae bacterium]|nr:hypothetical protein [Bacteriovoracaceae bacterium]
MKRNILLLTLIFSVIIVAFFSAQKKMASTFDIQALRLGMSIEQLKLTYGSPFAQRRNQLTYIFEDDSELIVSLRDDVVSSAQLKYKLPLKIEDPEMRKLTLVQMESEDSYMNMPSWFFAGKPQDGLIYKITSDGHVESLTWVPPFSYESNQPKQLQALLQDFQSQRSTNL